MADLGNKDVRLSKTPTLGQVGLPGVFREPGESPAMEREAKHLFRHLHDVRALRKNPISSVYCRNGVRALHEAILAGAEACREEDYRAGKDERAARQYVIVSLHCLERNPLAEVAVRLGISVRQCYRERADICGRIARLLSAGASAATQGVPSVDEFQHALGGALRRAALGDTARALRDCETLLEGAGPLVNKLQALRARVTILTDFGSIERVQSAFGRAERLWTDATATGETRSPLPQAAMALLCWQLAYVKADTNLALRSAEEAVRLLRSGVTPRSPVSVDMLSEAWYAFGTARCNAGDMQGGYECLASAEAVSSDDCTVSFATRSRIGVATWKLRCSLLTSAGVWRPTFERTQGLTAAFKHAYGSGDFAAAITALDAITQQHVVSGNHEEALRAANLALLIAGRQASERVKSQLAIRLALKLLPTSYAEHAAVLAGRAKAKACDGYHRQLIGYFRLEYALSKRRYGDALQLANEEAESKEYAALVVHRSLVRALAAQALGKRQLARSIIETAVPAAEALSSAHTLLDAYRAAARVTGEARFRRQAREITRLFVG
jgi:tetratricopeptide (TPR) repeat protein